MFNWSRPKCPVDPDVKTWIEQRMNWLVGQFGWEQFAEFEVLLPIEEHFPVAYDGSEEAVRELFAQVCEYMKINPGTVELKFYSEGRAPFLFGGGGSGTAGLYDHQEGQTTIGLEMSNLDDPISVAATFAHELCHMHLLGGNRLSRDETDHEAVTDLAAICLGMGVLIANASLRDHTTHRGNWSWWKISRQGYLTDPVLAYALALYAWARGERPPAWARYLRADIRSLFRQSLSYLEAMGEAVIIAPKAGVPITVGPLSPELVAKLFWKRAPKDETRCDEVPATDEAEHPPTDELFTHAVFLMQQGEFDEAVQLFSEVLRENPLDGETYQQRCVARLALGEVRDGLADAEKAVEYLPNDGESYFLRGRALLESRQYDRAIADFSRVIRTWPQWAYGYAARADAYDRLGEFKEAQADREKASRLGGSAEI